MMHPASTFVPLPTKRFLLRKLEPEDATLRYLDWLVREQGNHIQTAHQTQDITSLRGYINAKNMHPDCLLVGVFLKETQEHIGNIKYEPVDLASSEAVLGILIGEAGWRGKGVAAEIIRETADWLQKSCGIKRIVLGVSADNFAAQRAYEKIGFSASHSSWITASDSIRVLAWDIA